jgi:hypothetical protein
MMHLLRLVIFQVIIVLAIAGCSHGSSNPIQPTVPDSQATAALTGQSGRVLLGVWSIGFDPFLQEPIVQLNRTIMGHQNMLPLIPNPIVTYNEYNPNFGEFRGWVMWNLTISLSNDTFEDFYDVRGIVITGDEFLGIHNADGLTSVFDDPSKGDNENPFKYYGLIQGIPGVQVHYPQNYFVEIAPPAPLQVDCEECNWPNPDPPDPDAIMDHEFLGKKWFNFAVDASIDEPCEDPYSIDYYQSFIQTGPDPGEGFARITVHVGDHQAGSVYKVLLDASEVPGYGVVAMTTGGNDIWSTRIDHHPIGHEAIYNARIMAISSLSEPPDPSNNPDTLYKDIRIMMGDFPRLLEGLFNDPDPVLITGVKNDWASREEEIYPPSGYFNIESDSYLDGFTWYLHIKHSVGSTIHDGVIRLPPLSMKPSGGWPIMVSCHFGRMACDYGADDNTYQFYNSYKNSFAELIPTYRGNVLCFDGNQIGEYIDELNSPGDHDVDDVLAFLHAVYIHESDIAGYPPLGYTETPGHPLINTDRVGIMGGSRGGSPTYLAKVRDNFYEKNEIDRAMVVFGSVSDFFSPDIKTSCQYYIDNDGYVPDNVRHYCNEDYSFFSRLLEPYLHGEITLEEARHKMLLSSPYWFADDYLIKTQIHHGIADNVVRWQQADIMDELGDNNEVHRYLMAGHVPGVGDTDETGTYGGHTTQWLGWIIDGI